MLGVAVFFDTLNALIQLIPIAGQIIAVYLGIFAQLLFWFWFTINGVTFNTAKSFRFFGINILELIPLLNALPALTASVIITLQQVKKDDETAFTVAQKQHLEETYSVAQNENLSSEKNTPPHPPKIL